MTIGPSMVKALAEAIDSTGKKIFKKKDDESEIEFLRRVVPAISGQLRKAERLNPLEIALYELPRIALDALYHECGYNDEEVAKFKKIDSLSKVKQLSRLYESDPKACFPRFYRRMYAAEASVKQVILEKAPSFGSAKHFLKLALERDASTGELPEAIGSHYEITDLVDLGEKKYVVTFSKAIEGYEAIGNDFRITTLSKIESAHVIIDWKNNLAEYRGLISQAKSILNAFIRIAIDNKHVCSWREIEFTKSDAIELKKALNGSLKRAKIINGSGREDGPRSHLTEVDPSYVNQEG